jgi:osmotically-inducible protein OsmY
VLTNRPLENEVKASLERDPRIPFAAEIAVSEERGVVGLRGTVERLSQRRAAAEDAAKIDGVYDVVNHLKVNANAPAMSSWRLASTYTSGPPRHEMI